MAIRRRYGGGAEMTIMKMRFRKGTRLETVLKAQTYLGDAFMGSEKEKEGYVITYDDAKVGEQK